jgi:hypothetical protein
MSQKLAELLKMKNPFLRPGNGFSHTCPEDCLCWTCHQMRAWNRALEDVREKMEALHFFVEGRRSIAVKGPGYLVWIPEGLKCNTCDDKELVLRQDEIGFCPTCRPAVGAACV